MKKNILSLFANIGVAEAYLKEIGYNVCVANELDPKRAALYQKIYPDTKMICGDITQKNIFETIISASRKSGVNFILATPPCQGMSTAGKLHPEDPRNNLFVYAVQAIEELRPDYFMIENVPGFLSTYVSYEGDKMLIVDIILKRLGSLYEISTQVVNTKDYEVPQMRERMILLASKKGMKRWAMPQPSSHMITMEDAIGWIPPIDPFIKDIPYGDFIELFPEFEKKKEAALKISRWNIPPTHILRNVIAMQHTPTGCTAFDNAVYKPRKKDGSLVRGFHNTYKRQNWNTPAYTIAMDNIEISSQNNVHPGRCIGKDKNGDVIYSDARALTLYELMRLMSIPDNWPIPDETNPTYLRKVIGEGVPSLLVKKIFEQL